MPEAMSRLLQKTADFWKSLEKFQRNRIYITSAIIAVAVAVSIIFLTRPNFVPLIRSADTRDVGEMTKILDSAKVKYELKDNGSSIYINSADNNKAQVILFQSGYPKSGMTFEDAFKMIKINTTESDKKKLWEQYKKSTLIAKLKMFDNVKDADVDLALPEPSLFVTDEKDKQKPTAYVRVTPKGDLTPKQVEGIVLVVSRSVENLNPKDVTVVDNNLNVLNSETGDETVDKTNSQEELRLKKKKELEKNVYDMFNGQFDNFDSIRVVANPVLDFNKLKSLQQAIARPDGMDNGALISRHQLDESVKNSGNAGEPGMGTNPGTTAPTYPTGTSGNGTYTKKDVTENYDYTKTSTETEKALGDLISDKSSMTVSLWYGRRVTDVNKLSQEFIDQLKADVSKATGIPAANISVNRYKLAPIEVPKLTLAETASKLINDYGFFALVLILIIGLAIAAIPRRKPAVEAEPELALETAAAETAATGPRFIVPEGPGEPIPEIELEERSEVKKQIEKFVKQKPEAVAQLLRNWLTEDWE